MPQKDLLQGFCKKYSRGLDEKHADLLLQSKPLGGSPLFLDVAAGEILTNSKLQFEGLEEEIKKWACLTTMAALFSKLVEVWTEGSSPEKETRLRNFLILVACSDDDGIKDDALAGILKIEKGDVDILYQQTKTALVDECGIYRMRGGLLGEALHYFEEEVPEGHRKLETYAWENNNIHVSVGHSIRAIQSAHKIQGACNAIFLRDQKRSLEELLKRAGTIDGLISLSSYPELFHRAFDVLSVDAQDAIAEALCREVRMLIRKFS